MKILYLCPDLGVPVLGRKGAAVHVRAMTAAFHRAGHTVVLAAQVLKKSPWESSAEVAATIIQVRAPSHTASVAAALKEFNAMLGVENSLPGELRRILYNQEVMPDLKRRLESNPPDFIYERASLYGTAGVSLARELKVPLLLEINAPLAVEQSSYRGNGFGELAAQAERWTLSRADAVLAVSTPLREHVLALGVEANRAHVIPNGVESNLFQIAPRDQTIRKRLSLGAGPVLGFVGGLRPWHGVEVLPALVERLRTRHPKLRLVMVGDGQLRPQLQDEFRKRKLSEHVIFAGTLSHEEVAPVIRQFDVALAPYPRLEHPFYFSPLKLFEYMACGVSVVASEVGQISEVVQHGKTGMLYPAGDLPALAAACERLLGNPPLRRKLGRAAAKLVHAQYTWDRNATRVVELAVNLIAAGRTKNRPPS